LLLSEATSASGEVIHPGASADQESRTSRTLWARASIANGFGRNDTP
jgi:hypothetical protein